MLKQTTLDSCRYSSPARLAVTVLALCIAFAMAAAPGAMAAAPGATASAEVPTDRDVLVALYQAADGPNWRNSANWLSDAPLDSWRGVTTGAGGRVIELDLAENGLRGEIPPELGNLTNLTQLRLSENQLIGKIPPELGNLSSLTALFLFGNELSGEIPPELGNLSSLTWLVLSWNELSGEIPPELGNLSNLTELYLNNNRLSGEIPAELGNLSNLIWLALAGNQLRGCLPAVWRNVAKNDLDSLGLPFCVAPPTTDATDRDVLVAFYQAADGANWLNSANWLSDQPIGAWYGVTTNRNGRVTKIELPDNRLVGTIPSDLGNLTDLTHLDLHSSYIEGGNTDRNRLRGEIPSELGNLTDLKWLDLEGNELSGAIPSVLGSLTDLEWLDLEGNELSGSVPSELGNLTDLKWLDLGDNELSGAVPSELGNLTDLEWLDLRDNELNGAIPSELGNLTDLEWLDLRDNELNGAIPPELGNLVNLEWLDLGDNELRGSIPPKLGNLTNLEWLDLGDNKLVGSIPSELGNLANLTDLYLGDNKLVGSIPSELGNLANLEWLDLGDNKLVGSIPSELSNLTNLTDLYLGDNKLVGSIPSELGNLTNLTELRLSGNELRGCVPALWRNVAESDLAILGLPFCGASSATAAAAAATDREALVALHRAANGANWANSANWLSDAPLGAWHGVTTDGSGRVIELDLPGNQLSGTIPSELGKLTNLRQLSFGKNELSGAIPPQLGQLTNLKWLYLHENDLSGTIPSELGRLADLESLGLWDNELSGAIPPQLGQLTNLRQLSLSGNRLSGTIPSQLGQLTDLEILNLWDNELRGAILPALGQLTELTTLYLSENALSGCVPAAWRNVERNDLNDLGLPVCGAATDRAALIALYQAANGASWKNNANWLSDAPLAAWRGVTTGENGRVIGLDLRSNRLSGSIPSQLGNLTSLTRLLLSINRLRGAIPSELGNLTNLTELGLSNNRLSGDLPPELGNLTNLTRLALSINRLRGAIPSELGNLANLEKLYLAGNGLSGCVPGALWRNVRSNDLKRLGLPVCAAPSATSTASAESLTSGQVFAKVSPAIAFIETATATGAGVLIEGGYLVTNAHAVWPYAAARVLFPDGTEFEQVAVKGWDLLADLAVLGPIDAPVEPATLLDGEKIPIASGVYLVGHPGRVEAVPQPAITRGLLSRLREWEPVGVTYFQTDAALAGARSGGLLVSDTGGVIGVRSFRTAGGEFGLFASSTDILPRIRQLIAGQDPAGLGERRLPAAGGELRHELTLRNLWDELGFLINGPAGAEIELELIGHNDGGISVFDAAGHELLALDDEFTGAETGSFVAQREGPRFLLAWQLDETAADFTLTASHRLIPLNDPERGGQLQVGQTVRGNIDFPADIDHFLLHLEENETVEIVTRSALVDTLLTVDYLGAVEEQVVRDDDSGGGLFGFDARIIYRAPHTGSYFVVVADAGRAAPGGYTLSVNPADPDDASPQGAPSGFGLAQLRSAFTGLPASYAEIDPALMDFSPDDMAVFDMADAQFSHIVSFLTSDESHMIIAASGQLTGAERIAAFDQSLSEMEQALLTESAADLREGGEPQSNGLLEMSPVGNKSLGFRLEFIDEGAPIQMEMLFFRRGNLLASVVTVSFGPYDAQEHVSAEQAARALDAQVSRYLSAEQDR